MYIPSQRKECKIGYDALINNIKHIARTKSLIKGVALQFKIVEEYERPPYVDENFKFDLHNARNYHQHNRLCKYNKTGKFFAAYCVPEFIKMNDLYKNFNNSTLSMNSLCIKPTVSICDKRYHYITFGILSAHQHSKESNEYEIKKLSKLVEENNPKQLMTPKEFIEIIESIEEEYNEFEMMQLNRKSMDNSFSILYKFTD